MTEDIKINGNDLPAKSLPHKLQVMGQVGKGAFGIVYKAVYDGKIVAIKVLNSDGKGPEEQEAKRMFFREAIALQNSNQKNIVRFIALCKLNAQLPGLRNTETGRWALVEEFLKGGSLSRQVCSQMSSPGSTVYSLAQALHWSLDIAQALLYLHKQQPQVLHRDIKPANVLLTEEEGRQVAKLADFGLHVVVDESCEALVRAHSLSPVAQKYRSPFFRPQVTPDGEVQSMQRSGADAFGTRNISDNGSIVSSTTGYHRQSTLDELFGSMATTVTVASYNGTVIDDEDDVAALQRSDLQPVYQLSAMTGSAMYMAPEVFLGEPYNEKADVFSFGVTMFELFARTMLLFSELPVTSIDPRAPDRYAAKVAGGYRPRRPTRMPDELWQLVSDCWQQDPLERPDMQQVVTRLEQLVELEGSGAISGRRARAAAAGGGGEDGGAMPQCCTIM